MFLVDASNFKCVVTVSIDQNRILNKNLSKGSNAVRVRLHRYKDFLRSNIKLDVASQKNRTFF